MKKILLIIAFILVGLFSFGINRYVATNGNDNNAGTQASPYLTFQKACNVVNPGDVVYFADGTYTTTSTSDLAVLSRSGSAGNYITFRSINKYGAVLSGNNYHTENAFTTNNVSYVKFENFEIKQFATWPVYLYIGSHHIEISDCYIHDCGNICVATDVTWQGRVGVYCHRVNDVIIQRCKFKNIERLTPQQGCTLNQENNNYKNHDHSIYINGSNRITVKNNIIIGNHGGQGIHIYNTENVPSTYITIVNNDFYDGNIYYAAGHVMIWNSISNMVIANNIFHTMSAYAIEINNSYTYSNCLITKNITYGGNGTINIGTASGITITGNYNSTNPLFTNATTNDFTLQSNSPAINLGYASGVTDDFNGGTRTGTIDIGAFEYGAGSGTVYYSVAASGLASRNNCPTGYKGSTVTYTVVAGAYTSTVSQVSANASATADVTANKQAYANTNGTCTLIGSGVKKYIMYEGSMFLLNGKPMYIEE